MRMKPTFGLISRRGVLLQSHTLDTIGVYARTVDDLALVADAVAIHDPHDPVSLDAARPRLSPIAGERAAAAAALRVRQDAGLGADRAASHAKRSAS